MDPADDAGDVGMFATLACWRLWRRRRGHWAWALGVGTGAWALGVVDGVSERVGQGQGHGHRALAEPSRVQGSMRGARPIALLPIEEVANGGWGSGDNFLTRTTRNEHDRTAGQRGEFGSRGAPSDTR
jgi:hypothetical protein